MRAPGKIPAGTVCEEIASTMDILPTIAKLSGGKIPDDRIIDGHDIGDLIHGAGTAKSPTKAFFYYQRTRLQAVRVGRWKLHLPRTVDEKWGHYSKAQDIFDIKNPMLFDLNANVGEKCDVAAQHPRVVADLLAHTEHARSDIGDFNRIGKNARFFDPEPRRPDVATRSE